MNFSDIKSIFQNGLSAVTELINSLYAQIKELTEKNAQLEERIKELTEQKSKDSHNSSKPSSTDGMKKKTKSLRRKSKRSSGGQAGHKGTTLSMVAEPDKVERIRLKKCKNCNHSFLKTEKTFDKRQVIDVIFQTYVTEYQAECAECEKCKSHSKAEFPDFCKKRIQYGEGFKSLIVYLNKYQLLPLRRTAELCKDLFNLRISEASILNFCKEGYDKLEVFDVACKAALIKSKVMHNDESGGRCAKTLKWFQVASTNLLTHFAFHDKRGSKAMNDIGILSAYKGKSVHDYFKSYFKYTCEHILCNAHLLRELIFEFEIRAQDWANKMITLLLEIKEDVDSAKERLNTNTLSEGMLKRYEEAFDEIVNTGLRDNPYIPKDPHKRGRPKQTTARNLLDRLQTHKGKYLAFMYDFNVPFDNNLAERDIRMLKLYMKISGCFRTFMGASHFCRIRSYISTVKKNKLNILSSIQNIFNNSPFIPNCAE